MLRMAYCEAVSVHDGLHGLAGSAPGGPAVHQDGAGLAEDFPREVLVVHLHRVGGGVADDQRGLAGAAEGAVVNPVFRHAVLGAAAEAPDDHLVQRGAAVPAGGAVVEAHPGDPVLHPAVKAPDDHLVFLALPFLPHDTLVQMATWTAAGRKTRTRSAGDISARIPRPPALMKILGRPAMLSSRYTGKGFRVPNGEVPPTL